jgi:beta-lactamase regulating signal transducer with metallopeptidase domain
MIHLTAWIAPDVLRSLGLSLLHFLWQGAALAALAAAAMAFARRASARYVVAVAVLALMTAAPIITFNVLRNRPSPVVADVPTQPSDTTPATVHPALGFVPMHNSRTPANNQDAILWLVQVWFIGVLLFSLRTAGGVVLLERIRRRDAIPADDSLVALGAAIQRRMGLNRIIRYCESLELEAPAVIGWFRPVVLLPISALTGFSQEQLQAVIAHELAHIKRFDGFVNLFQVVVESLLFYHPAIWWLNRRIRAERENCCDDVAIALCGNPLEYARALTLMEERRAAPALAMAANSSPLAARIRRLLGAPSLNSGLRTLGLAAAILCLSAAVLAGNAFFASAHSAAAQTKPESPAWPASNPVIVVEAARPATTAAPKPQVAPAAEADPAVAASPAPEPAQATPAS